MANKAPINAQKAPEYFLNVPKFDSKVPARQEVTAKGLAAVTQTLAGTLESMQQRNDKIAMTAFERKLASMEKTLNLQADKANTPEAVDSLYKEYKTSVDNTAKEMLGDRLYGTWNSQESSNYYDLVADSMQRAKVPILQKAGGVYIDELIDSSARDRATASDEERKNIDATVNLALKYATFPEDNSVPIYDVPTAEAKLKVYKNKADLVALDVDSARDAREAMDRLNSGYYKNLSAEQIAESKPKIQKLIDKQEQEDLYNYAKALYTNKKSGQIDYNKVASYLNTQAERDLNVSNENAKAAADMAIARFNRDEQLKKAKDRKVLSEVYDKSFELFLGNDVEGAIQLVMDSDIPSDDKYTLIQKFKSGSTDSTGSGGTKRSNQKVFSDLAQRIVDEEIYDSLPIAKAYAKGDLTNADKNALIALISDVQQPNSKQYKDAMKQVDNAIKSGLFGYKQVDEDTKAYIRGQLTQEYRNAIKDGKSLQELETMFNPVRVNAMISQYVDEYPTIREAYNKQVKAELDQAAGTKRIQEAYAGIQSAISKGQIKTHDELKRAIEEAEKDNTYLNTVDAQFELEDQLNEVLEHYKNGVITAVEPRNVVAVSEPLAGNVARGTAGKPVLTLGFRPSIPGESIESYTERMSSKIRGK